MSERNQQKLQQDQLAGITSAHQTPTIRSSANSSKKRSSLDKEDDDSKNSSLNRNRKSSLASYGTARRRSSALSSDSSTSLTARRSSRNNSEGERDTRSQVINSKFNFRSGSVKMSHIAPMHVENYLTEAKREIGITENGSNKSSTSGKYFDSPNSISQSQNFLFLPASRNANKRMIRRQSSADVLVNQFSKSTSFSWDENPSNTTDSKIPQPRIFRRRDSKSLSISPFWQQSNIDDVFESNTSTPRKVLKRRSMFPQSGRPFVRRNSIDHSLGDSGEFGQQQQRWKNKAYSQQNSLSLRMLQNRLRVDYSQDFLNDARNRRKSKARRKTTWAKVYTPLERFRRIASLVRLLLRCLVDYRKVTIISQVSQMSFAMLSSDMVAARTYRHGLTFDPSDFRIAKEAMLGDKLRDILTLVPYQRSDKQIDYALKCLRAAVEEFAEFPLSMQRALAKVAWLDEFEPKRMIIRQGHKAETFYFIVAGTALVTRNRINANGEGYVETVSILKRGKSFGELSIMRHEQRANNVVSHTHIALLTVSRKDFIEIFMHRMDGKEPEFISFLRKLPELQAYPLYKIPWDKPKICTFTYFRVGVVISVDSNKSDVIVIVRSGVCRVVKRLHSTKPNLPGLKEISNDFSYDKISSNSNSAVGVAFQRPPHLTTQSSSLSLLTKPSQANFIKRLTFSLTRKTKNINEEFTLDKDSFFNKTQLILDSQNLEGDHKSFISKKYKKWQEEHPLSRDTFALLMTGIELEENKENKEEKNSEDEEDEEEDTDQFDIRERLDSYFQKRESRRESDEVTSRPSSIQSNFRTQILRRNRNSLANAWLQRRRKKLSSIGAILPTLNENSRSATSSHVMTPNKTKNQPVYIHIQTLREKDIFGLQPIVFNESEGATPVSLISDGAECILINKDFFIKHFDSELREKFIKMIQPFPSEETLQSNLQNQTNWDAYKFKTVHNQVIDRVSRTMV